MSSTIEQLEGEDWGEPPYTSHLVTTCHALRKKPIGEFTVENFRILIGQNIGTPHILPRAFSILRDSPMAEGDFFPGDLNLNVFKLPDTFWNDHTKLLSQWLVVIEGTIRYLETIWKQRRKDAWEEYGAQLLGESAAKGEEAKIMNLAREFLRKRAAT